MLLELLAPYRSTGSTVLDIGGGIGIIDQELLRAGAGHAVLVDGSTASLEVARDRRRLGSTCSTGSSSSRVTSSSAPPPSSRPTS